MLEELLAADARSLKAIESLRGITDPAEMEICFTEIRESVDIEIQHVKRLRADSTMHSKMQFAADVVNSDVEWKLSLISEFSFDLPAGWADAATACWAEKPWLRELTFR